MKIRIASAMWPSSSNCQVALQLHTGQLQSSHLMDVVRLQKAKFRWMWTHLTKAPHFFPRYSGTYLSFTFLIGFHWSCKGPFHQSSFSYRTKNQKAIKVLELVSSLNKEEMNYKWYSTPNNSLKSIHYSAKYVNGSTIASCIAYM